MLEQLRIRRKIHKMGKYLEASRSNYRKVHNNLSAAEESHKEIGRARNIMLGRMLKQQGLAICSDYHFIEKDNKNPSLDQLGVFPENQMRLLFNKSYSRTQHGHEYMPDETVGGEISVLSLCPEHFPEDPNSKDEDHVAPRLGNLPEGLSNEVIMKDGRLTLAVNGMEIDITKLGVNERIEKIQLNGREPADLVPNSPIYSHFGIPDLPARPQFDTVMMSGK